MTYEGHCVIIWTYFPHACGEVARVLHVLLSVVLYFWAHCKSRSYICHRHEIVFTSFRFRCRSVETYDTVTLLTICQSFEGKCIPVLMVLYHLMSEGHWKTWQYYIFKHQLFVKQIT
jgi:hypothetical protein